MSHRRQLAVWAVFLAAGLAASLRLGSVSERGLVVAAVDGQALAGQAAGGEDGGGDARAYQRLRRTADHRSALYGFRNFNRDPIEVSYQVAEKDFRAYNDSFGYTKEGLDELKAWRERARQGAYTLAVKQGRSQAQLDAALSNLEKEYAARLKDYLASRGFRLEGAGVVAVDIPPLVRRNAPLLKPLALAFERVAQSRRYRSPELVGAALAFVQTALHYRQPDPVYKGKHTGGFLPPVTALVTGWGDCDTKTGLLASILSNWAQMRMVGVSVPGHYLMGILLIPDKGDLFLEYRGLQYVLVEPAGPAWIPPGQVGEETSVLLAGREGYRIEPFFQEAP